MPTILYAENGTPLREAYAKVLREAGFAVHEASDGEEAWETAQAKTFDLVLSDLEMPRLGGIQLLLRLRKDARYKDTPFFILSGRSPAEGVAEQLGINWLMKPIGVRELVGHLQRFCPAQD